MARGRLSPLEIAVLRRNPYVEDVNETRIIYTYKFKCMFTEQYLAGARPVDIFRQAGFDVSVLGEKRIERATARWKALYAGNGVEGLKGTARKNGTADLPPAGQKGHAGLAGKKGQRSTAALDEYASKLNAHENRLSHFEKMLLEVTGRLKVLEKQSAEFAVKVDLLAEHGSLDEDYVLNKSHGNAYLYELIYEAMGKYAGRLSVNSLCDIFHVSRQGYYRYLKQRSLLET